ncbi:ATP synthase subunit e, mitochondrial [Candida viswanathii]|uniref:ATP synthase F(0) complex subunit e, mitochondrial n=1 Tax=Candida viswanathii TaxID=5486 RepID=A0A367Y3M9_9ASCO|nr:ATP synthase subunit e, mitochondrial [Candida viswanathii]
MSTFNVLRYSLLGAGIVYGAYSRYSIESAHHEDVAAKKWRKDEKLIQQAKAEYAKLHAPKKEATTASGSINWEDPNLDIGKALESLIQKLD